MASSSSSPRQPSPTLDVLPLSLQNTIMQPKFDQIARQRREARTVLRAAQHRARNTETDQQILLLMQADERLASLLSQAADSMCALLPVDSPSVPKEGGGGAKAFEEKAQQWFLILNEVQYSLRSAVRFLREAQLSPLTPPAQPEARSTGRAGSAARGHSLSLLEAFVDLGGLEGTTFKLPPADGAAASPANLPEANLSLQALRERHRNWKALSGSLQQISQQQKAQASPELSLLESIRNGCSSDRILIDALVNTNGMA